jgi:hypothetical protein
MAVIPLVQITKARVSNWRAWISTFDPRPLFLFSGADFSEK